MQMKVKYLVFDAAYREFRRMLNLKPHAKTEAYEGAIVLEPRSDLYRQWYGGEGLWGSTATLDFASLYPSVIQKDNICYSTFLETEKDVEDARACGLELVGFTDVRDSSKQVYFVQTPDLKDGKAGIIPQLEFRLKITRDNTRKKKKKLEAKLAEMEEAMLQTNGEKMVARVHQLKNEIDNLEQMQLAIKLIMNSIYGFFGAPGDFAILPQVHCASAITESGRRCILATREVCVNMTAPALVRHLDKGGLQIGADTERMCGTSRPGTRPQNRVCQGGHGQRVPVAPHAAVLRPVPREEDTALPPLLQGQLLQVHGRWATC